MDCIPEKIRMCFDFAYDQILKTGWHNCRDLFYEVFRAVMKHNLSLKYGLDEDKITELIDKGLMIEYRDCKEDLIEFAENKIRKADELERKVLAFFLNLKGSKSGGIYTFGDLCGATVIFNRIFDECLLAREHLEIGGDRLVFWDIGDILVKLGIGYWIPYVSSSCHVYMNFVSPTFLFDVLERNREVLPKIERFEERLREVQNEMRGKDWQSELHSIYLSKLEEPKPKMFSLPKAREPRCELDLIYLIGRYWDIIREKTGLEDIVFVDKHWDAEGIYKGKKVRIEIKVDANDFDKDPREIDVLMCWKATSGSNILYQLHFDEFENDERFKPRSKKIWACDYDLPEEVKECLRKLREDTTKSDDLIKDLFKCVGIDVIVLSEILR